MRLLNDLHAFDIFSTYWYSFWTTTYKPNRNIAWSFHCDSYVLCVCSFLGWGDCLHWLETGEGWIWAAAQWVFWLAIIKVKNLTFAFNCWTFAKEDQRVCFLKDIYGVFCLSSLSGAKPFHCFSIHHWLVNSVQRSPFLKDIILTTGDSNFAIWKEDVMVTTPVVLTEKETNIAASWDETDLIFAF